MGKQEKMEQVKELSTLLKSSKGIYFTDYRGLNVRNITDLRKRLRETNTIYKVTKNSILRRALKEAKFSEELINLIEGPTAIAITEDDPIKPIKVITDFKKEFKLPVIKGGFAEGRFITSEEVGIIAKIPLREELLGKVAGVLNSPITGFVWTLKGIFNNLVYTLNALINKKEEQ